MAGPRILIPGTGMVTLNKDTIEMSIQEVRVMAALHEFAHKHHVNIFCKLCEQPITGQNNDTPDTKIVSVSCTCREWVFRRR